MLPLEGEQVVRRGVGECALEGYTEIGLVRPGFRGGRQSPPDQRDGLGHRVDIGELGELLAFDGDIELPRVATVVGGEVEDAVPVLGIEERNLVGLAGLDFEVVGQLRRGGGIVAALVHEELPRHDRQVDVARVDLALLVRERLRVGVRRCAGQ